ncbi:DUF389 domain-containing protein [Amycolatopsis sp. NPDC051372]|uniref:DUF389 domain-containing protein n=1 Tax=Amycolatopsis sp. NPDC051372 TaxID=3155669 RepID=UPI003444C977
MLVGFALAGIVGIASLTEDRTSALLGVFISVTTIPAAADIGVSPALGAWDEARGSLLRLLLNIVVRIGRCQRIRSRMWSPTRMAFAIVVSAGFTALMLGKKLVSTT